MDETYIKIKGKWRYLYRAVDKYGRTIDFKLTAKRDKQAARAFLRKAFISHRKPLIVNIDKSGANNEALEHFAPPSIFTGKPRLVIRQVKYLNNILEQDHRHIKRITNQMGCFKKFHTAARTLAGIELMNMIKKKQFEIPGRKDLTPAQMFYAFAG